MKYLITGGTGFVGSHLYNLLSTQGKDVEIFSNREDYFDFIPPKDNMILGDIRNPWSVLQAAKGKDVIFHLAGLLGTDYLIDHISDAIDINVFGMLNVLEAAKETGAIVCNLSLLPEWSNPYMLTKNMASGLCDMYHKEFGVKTIVLQASHIYGPRQKWEPVVKAIPNFIHNALNNEDITVYGNGSQLMDLIYVDDAVKGILKSTECEKAYGRGIQFGSGVGISVYDVAKKIIRLCNSFSQIVFKEMRPGEPDSPGSYKPVDTRNQLDLLKFEPMTGAEEGLIETIIWYRNQLEHC